MMLFLCLYPSYFLYMPLLSEQTNLSFGILSWCIIHYGSVTLENRTATSLQLGGGGGGGGCSAFSFNLFAIEKQFQEAAVSVQSVTHRLNAQACNTLNLWETTSDCRQLHRLSPTRQLVSKQLRSNSDLIAIIMVKVCKYRCRIYTRIQIANTMQSVGLSLCWWTQLICDMPLCQRRLNWLYSDYTPV